MKRIATMSLLALFLVSVVAASVYAFPAQEEGEYGRFQEDGLINFDDEAHQERMAQMQEHKEQRREAMQEACDAGVIPEDLRGPLADQVQELEDFENLCALHTARQEAIEQGMSFEEVQELALDFGFELPEDGFGPRHGRHQGRFHAPPNTTV